MTKTKMFRQKKVNMIEDDACALSEACGGTGGTGGDGGGTGGDGGGDTGNCGAGRFELKAYFAEWSPYNVGEPTGIPGSVNKQPAKPADYDANTAKLGEKLEYVDTIVYSFAEIKQNEDNSITYMDGNCNYFGAPPEGMMNFKSTSYTGKAEDAGKLYIFDPWSSLKNDDANWYLNNKDLISEGYKACVPEADLPYSLGYGNLSALRDYTETPLTKILGIGGYGDVYQYGWRAAVNNPQVFADSVERMVTDYKFDGVDLDWEPLSFINKDPLLQQPLHNQFIELTRVLRDTLGADKKIGFPITVDTKQIEEFGEANWKALVDNGYVDEIGLMAYDMHGAFDEVTGLQSMTYPIGCDATQFSTDSAVQMLMGFGVPAEKISVGYPAYGRGLQGVCEGKLGAEFTGPHTGANLDPAIGISSYTWLVNKLDTDAGATEYVVTVDRDGEEFPNGAYMYFDNNVFYSYDNVETVTARANYVVDNGLKGMLTWLIENDLPPTDSRSLVKTVHDVFDAQEKGCTYNPERYNRLPSGLDATHKCGGDKPTVDPTHPIIPSVDPFRPSITVPDMTRPVVCGDHSKPVVDPTNPVKPIVLPPVVDPTHPAKPVVDPVCNWNDQKPVVDPTHPKPVVDPTHPVKPIVLPPVVDPVCNWNDQKPVVDPTHPKPVVDPTHPVKPIVLPPVVDPTHPAKPVVDPVCNWNDHKPVVDPTHPILPAVDPTYPVKPVLDPVYPSCDFDNLGHNHGIQDRYSFVA